MASIYIILIPALLFLFASGSIILGAIAWSRSVSLFLPFLVSLSASATLLASLTTVFLTGGVFFARTSSASSRKRIIELRNKSPTATALASLILEQFFTLTPAIIAALAATYIFPSTSSSNNGSNTCHLERTWKSYFQAKNADAIRSIQDSMRCCGLRSVYDMAWPFKDATHGDNACVAQLGYRQSCLGPWSEVEQGAAWMVFVAGVLTVLVNMSIEYLGQPRENWTYDEPREAREEENQPEAIPWINGANRIPRMLPYRDNVPIADAEEEAGVGRGNGRGLDDGGGDNHHGHDNGQGQGSSGQGAIHDSSDSSPWGANISDSS